VIGSDGASGDGAQPAVPMVLFQNEGKIFQFRRPVEAHLRSILRQCKSEHDEVVNLAACTFSARTPRSSPIDNQLRGRAGARRPRLFRFFLSLEDDLMRILRGERVKALMYRLGRPKAFPSSPS